MNINNKGFTMVELLAAVAILAIISGLAISGVSRILSKAHEEYYKSTEKNLVLAAQSYVQSNKSKLPKIIGKKTKITAKELREANYLKSDLTTYNGKTKCDEEKTYVNVFKYGKSDYSYTAYLTCKPDREAKEQLKDDTPTLDVKFPGNYEELRTANVTIDIQGSGDSTVKLLSYTYTLYYFDNNTNKYVQLMSSGSVESRQLSVSKTINLSKYTLHGSKRIKVVVSATNINGNSKSGAFMNDYQDKTPPSCDIKDVDKPNTPKGVKKWVNDKRTITVGCDDHDGSGCEKEKYTKTFTNNSITGFITIKDVEGNTRKCEVTTYIDKTAPTLTVNIYKANSHGNKTGDVLKSVTVNNKNKNDTIKSSNLPNNNNGWLNKAKYPYGIVIETITTDDIALRQILVEENAKNIKKDSSNRKTLSTLSNITHPYEFPNAETKAVKNNNPNKDTVGTRRQLVDEGSRYTKITVKDGFQNTVTVTLEMDIDRTEPNAPTVNGYQKISKDSPPNHETGLAGYTFDTWLKGWVLTKASTSTDSMSGLEGYFLTTSGQGNNDVTDSRQVYRNVNIEEGTVTIKYRARDYAGNWSSYTTKKVKLDRKGPTAPTVNGYKKNNATDVSSASGLSAYTFDTWLKGWVFTKASSSTDGGSGVEGYYLTTSGQSNDVIDKRQDHRNVNVSEGTVTIKYRAKDNVGNWSEYTTKTVKLDRVAPSAPTVNGYQKIDKEDPPNHEIGLSAYTFDTWLKGWVLTKASSSTDGGSGVEGYYLTTSGQGDNDVTNSRQVYRNVNVSEGTVTIKYRAKDNAGNWSDYTIKTVKLDRKAPSSPTVTGYKKSNDTNVSSSSGLSTHDSDTWLSGYLFVQASGSSDGGVGGVKYYLTTSGQPTDATNSQQSGRNVNNEGTVTVKYKACDSLSNCSSYTEYKSKLDRTAPDATVSLEGSNGESDWNKVKYKCTDDRSGCKVYKDYKTINLTSDLSLALEDNAGNKATKKPVQYAKLYLVHIVGKTGSPPNYSSRSSAVDSSETETVQFIKNMNTGTTKRDTVATFKMEFKVDGKKFVGKPNGFDDDPITGGYWTNSSSGCGKSGEKFAIWSDIEPNMIHDKKMYSCYYCRKCSSNKILCSNGKSCSNS